MLMMGVCLSYSQQLNLNFGTNFIPEKTFFQEEGKGWINLMYIGTSYTHTTGVNIGLTFTPHINQITLQTSVPLIAFKKKRKCEVFALIN